MLSVFATAPALLSVTKILRPCLEDWRNFNNNHPGWFSADIRFILWIGPDPHAKDNLHPLSEVASHRGNHLPPNVTSCQDNLSPSNVTPCQDSCPLSNVGSCQNSQMITANTRSSILPEPESAVGGGLGQDTSSRASRITLADDLCDEV